MPVHRPQRGVQRNGVARLGAQQGARDAERRRVLHDREIGLPIHQPADGCAVRRPIDQQIVGGEPMLGLELDQPVDDGASRIEGHLPTGIA